MEELEPKPQDPLQYLENDTRPEEVNPMIAVIDGEYKTAEQYLSEVENVR